jgi:mRNA-degrading endonuclease RelE of RelBE toxin-antitoxin system
MWKVEYKKRFLKELSKLPESVQAQADLNQVYNVAYGERTTLNELFRMIRDLVAETRPEVAEIKPVYRDFRPGDLERLLC